MDRRKHPLKMRMWIAFLLMMTLAPLAGAQMNYELTSPYLTYTKLEESEAMPMLIDVLGGETLPEDAQVIGGEDTGIAPGSGHAQPVVFPIHRGEIAHADEIAPVGGHAPEGKDAVVPVVRLDPLVAIPADIVGPKGRILQIEVV